MKRIRVLLVPALLTGSILVGLFTGYAYEKQNSVASMERLEKAKNEFLERAKKIERKIVENHPIYSDFRTSQKESELRRYLLQDHLREAAKTGIPPIASEKEMQSLMENGDLVDIQKEPSYYYFYNVRKQYRILTPESLDGLRLLGEVVQKKANLKEEKALAKFAISSVTRPDSYQKDLTVRNSNAALESSHSYGVSVDLFYDDFYLYMEPDYHQESGERKILDDFRTRMGFLMGDALRRQLRSILAESLLDLQRAGALYAIWEKRQRVYHVTFRPGADLKKIRKELLQE